MRETLSKAKTLADLKPYAAMKNSGVPWLGMVPEHWQVRRLKYIAHLNPSKAEAYETLKHDPLVSFLPMERVGTDGRIDASQKRSASSVSSGFTYFRRNDVLVAKITPCFENGKGACLAGLPTEIGFGSTEFHVLRARSNVLSPYLYRLTASADFRRLGEDAMIGAAGQQRVPEGYVANFVFPVPPCSEQAAIVRYLDHMDRRIRRYIRAKQKLIKLLEEQKQAIIHRAVTRGLAANIRLKPSGVQWLGDVPEHWQVKRAKYLFREVDCRSTTGAEVLLSLRMYAGLVPHHEVSNVPVTPQTLVGFKKVEPGRIVMNRMRAAIGMFGIVSQSGLVSPDYAVLEPLGDTDPMYFVRLFKTPAAAHVFRVESKGLGTGSSGFMRLYTDRFAMIKLPEPPRDEQMAIVKGIELGTQEIERTEQRINREVALLREYRTRLITDVVTGKLDVREIAARLPDAEVELELINEVESETDVEEDIDEGLGHAVEAAEG